MKKLTKVVLDSGSIISLAVLEKLELLSRFFDEIVIPRGVWEEVTKGGPPQEIRRIKTFFKKRVRKIRSNNDLISIMGRGESEAALLYRELKADFLIIDDKRARLIAEESGVNCIGTLSVLIKARTEGLEKELKPIFKKLLENRRYYKEEELNQILSLFDEEKIDFSGGKDG